MTDLIKREDAIKVVRNIIFESIDADTRQKMIEAIPTAEPKESFEWCTDCKEYDQEKHCCHRWTKAIRKTIAEIEEEYKPKRGEWIDKGRHLWECSNCKMMIYSESEQDRNEFHKWCSRCGARMKGADDE